MLEQNFSYGIDLAIAAAGSQAVLAARLGVSQQAISQWARQGWVPMRRASEIEAQFSIPRNQLLSPALVALIQTN